ncbi:unnamed protein product [Rhodiola kirilowii]
MGIQICTDLDFVSSILARRGPQTANQSSIFARGGSQTAHLNQASCLLVSSASLPLSQLSRSSFSSNPNGRSIVENKVIKASERRRQASLVMDGGSHFCRPAVAQLDAFMVGVSIWNSAILAY